MSYFEFETNIYLYDKDGVKINLFAISTTNKAKIKRINGQIRETFNAEIKPFSWPHYISFDQVQKTDRGDYYDPKLHEKKYWTDIFTSDKHPIELDSPGYVFVSARPKNSAGKESSDQYYFYIKRPKNNKVRIVMIVRENGGPVVNPPREDFLQLTIHSDDVDEINGILGEIGMILEPVL